MWFQRKETSPCPSRKKPVALPPDLIRAPEGYHRRCWDCQKRREEMLKNLNAANTIVNFCDALIGYVKSSNQKQTRTETEDEPTA
jgi:hypothetical protein